MSLLPGRLERRRRVRRRRALAQAAVGGTGLLTIGLLFLPAVLAGPPGWFLLAFLFLLPFVSMLTLVVAPIGLGLA